MISIAGHIIDVATAIDHKADAEVTDFPVEQGADFTDHVRRHPLGVTITGIVSDTPLAPHVVSARGDTDENGKLLVLPSDEARAFLTLIYETGEPITVVTPKRTYKNVVMQSLSEIEDVDSGDAYRFVASFREIRLITNERTTKKVAIPRGAKRVNRNSVPAETVATPPALGGPVFGPRSPRQIDEIANTANADYYDYTHKNDLLDQVTPSAPTTLPST